MSNCGMQRRQCGVEDIVTCAYERLNGGLPQSVDLNDAENCSNTRIVHVVRL